jgi:anti-sigma regulatory factor (Ser/Thr protein kinase)
VTDAGLETAPAAVELTLPARPESVALARLALAGVAAVAGATAADTADLKLAVSEVCTSVVRALGGDDEDPIVVRYASAGHQFAFDVEHPRRGLDLGQLDAEPLLGPSDAALGLAVARAVTDSLRIETAAHGTRIVAARRLTSRAS